MMSIPIWLFVLLIVLAMPTFLIIKNLIELWFLKGGRNRK